jgi:hypothetical protein
MVSPGSTFADCHGFPCGADTTATPSWSRQTSGDRGQDRTLASPAGARIQSDQSGGLPIAIYWARDREPWGLPVIGWSIGSGRPAVAKPFEYSSSFSLRKVAKLSG